MRIKLYLSGEGGTTYDGERICSLEEAEKILKKKAEHIINDMYEVDAKGEWHSLKCEWSVRLVRK